MEYYNQPNNSNNERQSVNTRGASYKNGMCKFPMALEVGYSDDLISLTFTPPLPDQDRVKGQRLFDYKNQIKTGMSRSKAHLLYMAYEEYFIPALKKNEGKFVGVRIASGKHVIGIDTGVDLFKDGTCHPCIILIRNVDESGVSNDVLLYEFNKEDVLIDYNPSTGKIAETAAIGAEFDEFMKNLEVFRAASSKAYVHANRQVNNRYRSMISDNIKSMMQKMGLQSSSGNSYTGGGNNPYKGASIFDINDGATGSDEGLPFDNDSMPAPSATISDMDQLAAELGM